MKKCIFIVLSCCLVHAANLGIIKGRITDTDRAALVGVNIIVEGTEMGAATDESGEFIIPFVPAGTYTVTASYIGYNSISQKNVVVYSNQTTVINYTLSEMIITMETIVVNAERDMVIKTQTQTQRTVTAQDINMLPISDINEIISLQAGVSTSELGTHIRGGRGTEIAYFVDGILTKAPHYSIPSVNINKQAVEEIAVATGGFDAEYGEALSGVVNVVTREGGEKFGALLRYTTDEIFSARKLNYGYNLYELSLGGNLLAKSRFRYFLSGEAMLTDAFEAARYPVPSERFDYKLEGKLSYRLPGAKGKLIASAFTSREQYMPYADIWGNLGFIYNLEHNYGVKRNNQLATVTANYMLGENSIIESKFGYTTYERFRAVRDLEMEAEQERQWYDDYIFKAEHILDDLKTVGEDTVKKHYLIDTLMNYYVLYSNTSAASLRNNPYGATGIFYTYGDQRMWRYEFNRDYQAVLSVTNSIANIHEIKTGVTIIKSKILWYDNNLPYFTNPFWDLYEKEPLRIAGYVQDRMDFKGIIARLGIRLDYFDSQAAGLANHSNRSDSTEIAASPKIRVSPRIGFSLPITDRSKFRFNYGHFFQTPRANDLYRATEPMVIWAQRQNNVLGNPDLTVEKTVAYEIGYENQFTDVFAFGFIAYYKDIFDLVQTKRVVSLPYPYYQVTNSDYGNVKGIEVTLEKRMYNYWSMDLSYTLQFAKGTASDAWQYYYDVYIDQIYSLPQIDYWLNFDERHIVNASMGFQLPEDFRFVPLQNFLTNVVFSYHSGFPYTPENSKGEPLGDQNSARLPGYFNIDMNVSKDIVFHGVSFSVFTNIYNLLNTEQITQVYAATGLPGDDGGAVTTTEDDFTIISMSSAYYSPQADYNHDGLNLQHELLNEYLNARAAYYNNPFHWNQGFRMRVGVGLKF
jgi:hypothetical protein